MACARSHCTQPGSAAGAFWRAPRLSARTTRTPPAARSVRATGTDTVVPQPSYAIPAVLLGLTGLAAAVDIKPLAAVTGVLAVFLAIQASRVRFRFEPDALEVVIGEEESETENRFVGGENRWKFDTFVNWEFWWPAFPVLVYFKETQTKPEGQIHFFPIIFNGRQLYDVMVQRCGASRNSLPK